jgi:hypothetical protein
MAAIAHARAAVKKGIAVFPPIFRPGLLRESLYMAATMKNWREWVGALYGRDGAPRRALFRNGMLLESSVWDSLCIPQRRPEHRFPA